MSYQHLLQVLKGSASSGNWGHAGRQGKRGGSAPKSGVGAAMSLRTGADWQTRRDVKINPPKAFDIPLNKKTLNEVERHLIDFYGPHDTKKALDNFKNYLDGSDVNMRVPADIMLKILADGRFKNQHETGTSRGTLDNAYRLEAERNAFGDNLSKPEELPVYGYVNTYDKGFRPSVSGYGNVRIVFNENVKSRTTVTGQDSLEPFAGKDGAATPMLNPSVASLDGDLETYRKGGLLYGYVEAQIHGGLTTKDIKHVYVPDNPVLIKKLKEAKIPHTVITDNAMLMNMDAVK